MNEDNIKTPYLNYLLPTYLNLNHLPYPPHKGRKPQPTKSKCPNGHSAASLQDGFPIARRRARLAPTLTGGGKGSLQNSLKSYHHFAYT